MIKVVYTWGIDPVIWVNLKNDHRELCDDFSAGFNLYENVLWIAPIFMQGDNNLESFIGTHHWIVVVRRLSGKAGKELNRVMTKKKTLLI